MRAPREQGFTLIEVTVAFAIFALSAAVLYEEFAGAQRRSAQARDHEEALLRAQSLLAQQRAAPPPWSAEHSGQSDDGWGWQIEVAPFNAGTPAGYGWKAFEVTVRARPVAAPAREAVLKSIELARTVP
jgi:prepilin-type N-terminal cleavage/methylation domain-containing protein